MWSIPKAALPPPGRWRTLKVVAKVLGLPLPFLKALSDRELIPCLRTDPPRPENEDTNFYDIDDVHACLIRRANWDVAPLQED